MTKLREVCQRIRSKNAGPFWVTIDLFFDSAETFRLYENSKALEPALLAGMFGADPKSIKVFKIKNLNVIKISYPRVSAQGGTVERDMHSGQQYVRILDLELH